jgi:DNA excision repair protein ERCC-4
MDIIVDSREQKPYTEFFDNLDHKYEVKKLDVGDYSIKGYEDQFAIERKELNDFIQSITRERIRFSIELEKARKLQYFAVIVEGSFYDIKNKNYKSFTNPQSILSTLFMWSVKFDVPIFLVDSREGGALAVLKFAEAFLKYKVYEDGNKSNKD